MRELNIDWAALHSAFQMNMPEVRCFLCIEDGRVLKLPPGDPALGTVRADPQRFVAIDAIPSRIQYQWLDEFIKSIEEGETRNRMEAAINGKGAFRRFKDILLTLPDERRRWFEYRDQMMRQRIIDWVREQSITPLNEAPWLLGEIMPGSVNFATELSPISFAQPLVTYAPPPVTHIDPSPGNGIGSSSIGNSSSNVGNSIGNSGSIGNINGNFAPAAPSFPQPVAIKTAPPALNSQHEVEALRDFLIEWSDNHHAEAMNSPLSLEELAMEIAKRFVVRSVHP